MWTLSSVSTLWTRNEYTEHKGRHTIASRLALVLWYVRLFRFISLHFDIFFSTVHPCFCPEFFLPFIIIFHFIWCYCVCRWEPTARYTLLYSVRCRLFNAHSQFALFHLIRFSSLLFFFCCSLSALAIPYCALRKGTGSGMSKQRILWLNV